MRKTLEGFSTDLTGKSRSEGRANESALPLPLIKQTPAGRGLPNPNPRIPDINSLRDATADSAVEVTGNAEAATDILSKVALDFADYIAAVKKTGATFSFINLVAILDLLFGNVPGWAVPTGKLPLINWTTIERMGLRSCFNKCKEKDKGFFIQIYWWQKSLSDRGLQVPEMREEIMRILGQRQA